MSTATTATELSDHDDSETLLTEDLEHSRLEEIELLEAIYINELTLEKDDSGQVNKITMVLHPATGENAQLQYVCLTMHFSLPHQYPCVAPEMTIRNPRGLSDEHLMELRDSLHQLAEDRKGSPMLYELIEHVKESLTQSNVPHGSCIICLELFSDGQQFTKTQCYHYFHTSCLLRYIQHSLQEMEAQRQEAQQHQHLSKQANKNVVCPICRESLNYEAESLENIQTSDQSPDLPPLSEDIRRMQAQMAQLFKKQKEKGGIIDVEAEKNKYLVTNDTVLILPSEPSSVSSQSEVPQETAAVEGSAKKHNRRRVKRSNRTIPEEYTKEQSNVQAADDKTKRTDDPEVVKRRMMNQRRQNSQQYNRNQQRSRGKEEMTSKDSQQPDPLNEEQERPKKTPGTSNSEPPNEHISDQQSVGVSDKVKGQCHTVATGDKSKKTNDREQNRSKQGQRKPWNEHSNKWHEERASDSYKRHDRSTRGYSNGQPFSHQHDRSGQEPRTDNHGASQGGPQHSDNYESSVSNHKQNHAVVRDHNFHGSSSRRDTRHDNEARSGSDNQATDFGRQSGDRYKNKQAFSSEAPSSGQDREHTSYQESEENSHESRYYSHHESQYKARNSGWKPKGKRTDGTERQSSEQEYTVSYDENNVTERHYKQYDGHYNPQNRGQKPRAKRPGNERQSYYSGQDYDDAYDDECQAQDGGYYSHHDSQYRSKSRGAGWKPRGYRGKWTDSNAERKSHVDQDYHDGGSYGSSGGQRDRHSSDNGNASVSNAGQRGRHSYDYGNASVSSAGQRGKHTYDDGSAPLNSAGQRGYDDGNAPVSSTGLRSRRGGPRFDRGRSYLTDEHPDKSQQCRNYRGGHYKYSHSHHYSNNGYDRYTDDLDHSHEPPFHARRPPPGFHQRTADVTSPDPSDCR